MRMKEEEGGRESAADSRGEGNVFGFLRPVRSGSEELTSWPCASFPSRAAPP